MKAEEGKEPDAEVAQEPPLCTGDGEDVLGRRLDAFLADAGVALPLPEPTWKDTQGLRARLGVTFALCVDEACPEHVRTGALDVLSASLGELAAHQLSGATLLDLAVRILDVDGDPGPVTTALFSLLREWYALDAAREEPFHAAIVDLVVRHCCCSGSVAMRKLCMNLVEALNEDVGCLPPMHLAHQFVKRLRQERRRSESPDGGGSAATSRPAAVLSFLEGQLLALSVGDVRSVLDKERWTDFEAYFADTSGDAETSPGALLQLESIRTKLAELREASRPGPGLPDSAQAGVEANGDTLGALPDLASRPGEKGSNGRRSTACIIS